VQPDARAVVFDLDDTLYAYRRFVLSGFREVARHLQRTRGADASGVFRRLASASRGPDRGRELQVIAADLGLTDRDLARLIEILRHHEPGMHLPRPSQRLLGALRAGGWRLGVLTNGAPEIQARKVRALGLSRHVDAVVYAAACGSGRGKPDPAAFAEVAGRLGVAPRRAVMVGDDEACDIAGATGAGMRAIRCAVWRGGHGSTAGSRVVTRFREIPGLARILIEEASDRHAA
jgi:putative hydrolase of the HAD superfamily